MFRRACLVLFWPLTVATIFARPNSRSVYVCGSMRRRTMTLPIYITTMETTTKRYELHDLDLDTVLTDYDHGYRHHLCQFGGTWWDDCQCAAGDNLQRLPQIYFLCRMTHHDIINYPGQPVN
ncbi:hypothetical protein P168DRAFT_38279 [Aspergillus campestris IBT 28561]|uniref:Cyanovirin-N domain-containing protein n=1 Tax=Aspergillus campestris (strain IBT 28561) TaxID=1392248 RepID=A0A2I1CWE0_ASPC2|nr:uncharacterized protein P168DRAFT_38279 [Aspergillus campestris IBT 28561]PKY01935.1 hypothetical protein P168DRAFT_38279 [Aspergillus campestris IBT 28561]